MYFEPNGDQVTFLSVLDQMMASADARWKPTPDWERYDWPAGFDRMLEDNGFFDCAAEQSLGPVAAVAMIHRLAALPVAVESAASCVLRPVCAPDLPRPVAVIEGDIGCPTRFLPVARSVVHLDGDIVRTATLDTGAVEEIESLFAYPMGILKETSLDWRPVAADPSIVVDRWRVAVAAEISGALKGGLEAVLAHVRDRKQFGRPLGSFQAIQHRLAEDAVRIEAAELLALRAAQSADPLHAAATVAYMQDASTEIVYDLHQFMGAMGLTLEHPLHRWTYRVKLLRSALGGAQENYRLASTRHWGD